MRGLTLGVFRSLSNYNYRLWAAGALVSNIGTWMQRIAQDWLVLAHLTQHSASAVGVVMALQFAPQLLLLPWTGTAADRYNQRKLLIITQGVLGLLALTLGALVVTGVAQLWHVYVLAALQGCAAAFDAPVRQTFVAELVSDEQLSNAIALNSTSFNAGRMIGPAVAGLTIAAVGPGWAFVLNGASYAAVLTALFCLRASELRPNARATRAKGGFAEGLSYAWGRSDFRTILIMLFVIGTFGLNFPIYIATMAVEIFHTDARGYGLLSSLMAIGTLSGALMVAGRKTTGFGVMTLGAAIFGLGCALGAFATTFWLFAATLILSGAAGLVFANCANSIMQVATEPSMRGRVAALRVGVALGGTPIGAPTVGWIADTIGPRYALGVGALAGLAAAGVAILYLRRGATREGHGDAG